MSVSLASSVRMFPVSEYPVAYKVYYESVSNDDRDKLTGSEECLAEEPLTLYPIGKQFKCLGADSKTNNTWEIVSRNLFIPDGSDDNAYTGVIICGCRLVSSEVIDPGEYAEKIQSSFAPI